MSKCCPQGYNSDFCLEIAIYLLNVVLLRRLFEIFQYFMFSNLQIQKLSYVTKWKKLAVIMVRCVNDYRADNSIYFVPDRGVGARLFKYVCSNSPINFLN